MRIPLLDGWVDLDRRRVVRGERVAALTEREARLLACLSRHSGRPVPRDALYDDVWGEPPRSDGSRALDTAVRRLRSKIEPAPARPQLVQTVPNVGYRFVTPQAGAPRARVPADADELVGRTAALAAIRAALDQRGWVWVHGVGGVGKSRLLRAAARAWSAHTGCAAWWVSAEGAQDEDELVVRVARALALQLGPRRVRGLAERLSRMAPQLIVIDGADGLASDALGGLTDAATPGGLHVAVSRRGLAPPDAPAVRVEPLPLDDAEALLLAQVRVRAPEHPGSGPAIQRLLVELGGLPLALRLAAIRLPVFGADELHERLVRGDDALVDPGDRGEHGALARVLDGSWAALPAPLRAAALVLAEVRGPFDASFADALQVDPCSLRELHDAGWLERAERFEVLPALLSFLRRQPGYDRGVRRLAAALCAQAAVRLGPVFTAHTPEACAWVRDRAEDLDACTTAGHDDRWLVAGAAAAAALVGDTPGALARWARRGDDEALVRHAVSSTRTEADQERALRALSTTVHDPGLSALIDMHRGHLASSREDPAVALPLLERALDGFERIGDAMGIAKTCFYLARTRWDLGDPDGADQALERGIAGTVDAPLGRAQLLTVRVPGPPARRRERLAGLRGAVDVARDVGFRGLLLTALREIAVIAASLGEVAQAEAAARAGIAEAAAAHGQARAVALVNCGIVLLQIQCLDAAEEALTTATHELDRLYDGVRAPQLAIAPTALALLALDRGQTGRARDWLAAARDHAGDAPLRTVQIRAWDGAAEALDGRSGEASWRDALSVAAAGGVPGAAAPAALLLAATGAPDASDLLLQASRWGEAQRDVELTCVAGRLGGQRAASPAAREPQRWSALARLVERLS